MRQGSDVTTTANELHVHHQSQSFLEAFMKSGLLTVALAALSPLAVQGAVITWATPQNISGDSDVLTQGTLVLAENLGKVPTTTTVNGVTVTAAPGYTTGGTGSNPMGSVYFSSGGASANDAAFGSTFYTNFAALSTAYQTLLAPTLYSLGTGFKNSSLQNLTVGKKYAVQIFVQNMRGDANSSTVIWDGANLTGNSVTLSPTTNIVGFGDKANGRGQYVIGTFTADATSQSLTLSGAGTSIFNAYQVRAVPEPTSLALFSGVAGVFLFRRRSSR
jgi:hypothetical protein